MIFSFIFTLLAASSSSSSTTSSTSSSSSSSSSSSTTSNIKPSEADTRFHSWCESVHIDAPSVQLATTPLSVAGRGVFAIETIDEDDVVITIPPHCILTSTNAANYFPSVAKDLHRRHRTRHRIHRRGKGWFNRIFRRSNKKNDLDCSSWQAELTAYALAAIETDHPWAEWIDQWQRDDPVFSLFEKGVLSSDQEAISVAVNELHSMLPELSKLNIEAAIQIRMQRFEEEERIYLSSTGTRSSSIDYDYDYDYHGSNKASIARMHSMVGSRALDLGEDIIGVVPMYDMVNHSLDPNLGFHFNGNNFELFARRTIQKGEELFLNYANEEDIRTNNNGWDENDSLWTLITWGIPMSVQDANDQLSQIS